MRGSGYPNIQEGQGINISLLGGKGVSQSGLSSMGTAENTQCNITGGSRVKKGVQRSLERGLTFKKGRSGERNSVKGRWGFVFDGNRP